MLFARVAHFPRMLTFVSLWVSENRLFWVERQARTKARVDLAVEGREASTAGRNLAKARGAGMRSERLGVESKSWRAQR